MTVDLYPFDINVLLCNTFISLMIGKYCKGQLTDLYMKQSM